MIEAGTHVTITKGTRLFKVRGGSRITTQTTRFDDAGTFTEDTALLFIGYQRGKGTRGKMALLRMPDCSIVAVEASAIGGGA
jgi:hypothetical protein